MNDTNEKITLELIPSTEPETVEVAPEPAPIKKPLPDCNQ